MQRNHGFTLIELLVSTAILGIVVLYFMQTFTIQHRTYVTVDEVTEAQQDLRIVSDLIEHDVRMAGFLAPKAAAACGVDRKTAADTLFVANADVIRAVDSLAAVDLDKVAGDLGAPVSAAIGFTASGASKVVNLQRNWVDVAADGPDFAANAGVILVDKNDGNGRVACGVVKSIAGNAITVDFGPTSVGPTGPYSELLAVPAHVYTVGPATAGTPSQLLRDGLLLANDVEDLQVAFLEDANNNRQPDPGEYKGDGAAADYDPAAVDGARLRELRVNIVVATRTDDPNQSYARGQGQATENRTAASVPGQDGRRRRVHEAVVRLRNVRKA